MRDEERGSVVVMVALLMTAMLGIAALAIDGGRLYLARQRLENVADAASLSAVQQLPDDPTGAVESARQYLTRNGIDPATATIAVDPDNRHIRVALNHTVTMTFAQVLGIHTAAVAGGAKAEAATLSGAQGAAPFGVPSGSWAEGQEVYLKLAPHSDGELVAPGNYQALALGQNGAAAYEQNLMYGYSDWIRVGDWLYTKPGNMAGPTIRAVDYRIGLDPLATWNNVSANSPRLLLCPVLEDFEVNGAGQVHVIGFAMFFLENAIDQGSDKGEVIGRFVRSVALGEVSATAPDYGVHVDRLSE